MEPMQVVSLDDLGTETVAVTITRGDGRELAVPMKPLSEAGMRAIRRAVKWPDIPIKDMTKTGPVYDRTNPDYLRAVEDANRELGQRILVASLDLPIPGMTVEEQCTALSEKVGQRIFTQLVEASQALNIVSVEELAAVARSFRPGRVAPGSGNGSAGDGAG